MLTKNVINSHKQKSHMEMKEHIKTIFGIDSDAKYNEVLEAIAARQDYKDKVVVRSPEGTVEKDNPQTKEDCLIEYLKRHLINGVKAGIIRLENKRATEKGTELAAAFQL